MRARAQPEHIAGAKARIGFADRATKARIGFADRATKARIGFADRAPRSPSKICRLRVVYIYTSTMEIVVSRSKRKVRGLCVGGVG